METNSPQVRECTENLEMVVDAKRALHNSSQELDKSYCIIKRPFEYYVQIGI